MSLTIEEQKELFKAGYEGVVADAMSKWKTVNLEEGFGIGTKIKIIDVSSLCVLWCENEYGEFHHLLPSEVLITKIQ